MERKQEIMEEKSDVPVMPVYQAEKIIMHQNFANRRMLIALISVLLTTAIIVIVFTSNQTKREQMWQETIKSMYSATVTEVDHGQQNTDP